jgi:hypothetical protein
VSNTMAAGCLSGIGGSPVADQSDADGGGQAGGRASLSYREGAGDGGGSCRTAQALIVHVRAYPRDDGITTHRLNPLLVPAAIASLLVKAITTKLLVAFLPLTQRQTAVFSVTQKRLVGQKVKGTWPMRFANHFSGSPCLSLCLDSAVYARRGPSLVKSPFICPVKVQTHVYVSIGRRRGMSLLITHE